VRGCGLLVQDWSDERERKRREMWHVVPWRHAGAQPHGARKAGKEFAEEPEAFLQGRLAAQLSLER